MDKQKIKEEVDRIVRSGRTQEYERGRSDGQFNESFYNSGL